jgi:hypothetical protein
MRPHDWAESSVEDGLIRWTCGRCDGFVASYGLPRARDGRVAFFDGERTIAIDLEEDCDEAAVRQVIES